MLNITSFVALACRVRDFYFEPPDGVFAFGLAQFAVLRPFGGVVVCLCPEPVPAGAACGVSRRSCGWHSGNGAEKRIQILSHHFAILEKYLLIRRTRNVNSPLLRGYRRPYSLMMCCSPLTEVALQYKISSNRIISLSKLDRNLLPISLSRQKLYVPSGQGPNALQKTKSHNISGVNTISLTTA